MFLIEHHGKELLASHGIPVPWACSCRRAAMCALPHARRARDGQGAGRRRRPRQGRRGAERAASRDDVARIIAGLDGRALNGKPIHGFRIEQRVDFVHEAYVSLSVDGETARIRIARFRPKAASTSRLTPRIKAGR